MIKNICHFVPYRDNSDSVYMVNFVLETELHTYNGLKTESLYKMYYVRSGRGRLHTLGRIYDIEKGDVFFTFPAFHFCIESVEDFSFMYVSFLGNRGNMLLHKNGISSSNFVFKGCSGVGDFWNECIRFDDEFCDIISESVLLYTFAYLGEKLSSSHSSKTYGESAALAVKKYIDDNFTSDNLCLETISKELSYNPKYISSVFKKELGTGLVDYVNNVRINHACTLIEKGFSSVCDIASYCGFSDPRYFSKVFKKKMDVSPGMYIRNMRKNV